MAVFAGNGSNGSPSFTFSSSPTTGIYRPAADAITLVTGGSNRFTINGTNTIVSSTTTPRTNVRGLFGAVIPSLNVEQAIGYISVVSNYDNTTNGTPGELQLCRSGATAVLSNTAVANGNWLGMISFQGTDGSDMEYAARIRAIADGTVAANQMPGTLIFETTPAGSATPAEIVRMTTNKYLRMASGTGGIQFNGDTAATNALDDYEEGSWTPVYTAQTGTFATMTMNVQSARYVKVGNVVTVEAYVVTSNVDVTGASGLLYLSGLPFTSYSTTPLRRSGAFGYTGAWNVFPTAWGLEENSSKIRLYSAVGPGVTTNVSDLTTGTGSVNILWFGATYIVN